ncbi:MAG: hypothetical protein M3N29_02670 [Chloroflexota bacterium]|nr:hypothetical protein [Chloroflexota bacterium]
MNAEQLISALIGAFFGAAGWLLVGLYMQRRLHERQARNAARAVYFELEVNRIVVDVARRHSVFRPLSRTSFERLLPELATWLGADELQTLTRAYMSHAGYEQAGHDQTIPGSVRAQLLERIVGEHEAASALLRRRAFSRQEAARLLGAAAEAPPGRRRARNVA